MKKTVIKVGVLVSDGSKLLLIKELNSKDKKYDLELLRFLER